MSFIAGYLLGLDEDGSTYINEQKTITSNGEYKPDDGVRWDKVTVDIPVSSDIPSMQVIGGGSLGTNYHFLFHRGQSASRYGYQFNRSSNGDAYILKDYNSAELWLAIYKNDGNKFLCAKNIVPTIYSSFNFNGYDYYWNEYHFHNFPDLNSRYLSLKYEYLGGGITSTVYRSGNDVNIEGTYNLNYKETHFNLNGEISSQYLREESRSIYHTSVVTELCRAWTTGSFVNELTEKEALDLCTAMYELADTLKQQN